MLFHPAVIALLVITALVCLMFLYASFYAYHILASWDLSSGSELQLSIERKTYLIAIIVSYACAFELLSLFLYVFVAEDLHTSFVGAMCAAGTLNVNSYGYPALIYKIVNFLAVGAWLIISYVDNKAEDYPLIRPKYILVLAISLSVLYETWNLANYFFHLKGDVITSCCGSIFGTAAQSIGSSIAASPIRPTEAVFGFSVAASLASGIRFYFTNRGGYLFPIMTVMTFFIAILSVITFISPYFYELPTHHCPFCILQPEYHYVGYLLYAALLGATVAGVGVGAIEPFTGVKTLKAVIPDVQRKLAFSSLICTLIFVSVVLLKILSTDFVLQP